MATISHQPQRKTTLLCTAGFLLLLLLQPLQSSAQSSADSSDHSVARQWNEALLHAIRNDFARPTVHARNLFHASAASWDAWAAYAPGTSQWLHRERQSAADPEAARAEAISHANYGLLRWRFRNSPGAATVLPAMTRLMLDLGLDPDFSSTEGDSPAALGNRIAARYIAFGLQDNSNEGDDYSNRFYRSVNPPLLPDFPGNPDLVDANRYQPLSLRFFFDQAGNPVSTGFPEFLSPEWGQVVPFALNSADLELSLRDGFAYWTFHDPGPPPLLGGPGQREYQSGFAQVLEWSGLLDPAQGGLIDISPASRGNNLLGNNAGKGHILNPATGRPYEPQWVPAGDYYRVLAEFWADGPDSETPPGHWFAIANEVNDHPALERRLGRQGTPLNALEWDVKLYFALGGAMHDSAISAWGVKGRYDYIRPISAIRAMAALGQSSDPALDSYHPQGLPLRAGAIELITPASVRPGERHEHLAGAGRENLGKIAVFAWRGPDFIRNPATDVAGTGWILAENWWPYQRPSFVTPPFAGYVSGHSTYSRAAAEVLTAFTGSAYFPGGLGAFAAPANDFLVFEQGPSVDITLQWATYRDAADETSLSRIYGGIHPRADDIPGRIMGAIIGVDAFARALQFFHGEARNGTGSLPVLPPGAGQGLSSLSGSWYDPQRPGEGWSIMALDERSALIYWLMHDRLGNARWLWGTGEISGNTLVAAMSNGADGAAWGSLALTFKNCDVSRVEYRPAGDPRRNGRLLPRRLTRLAALPCRSNLPGAAAPVADDESVRSGRSGIWQESGNPGESWVLEALGDGRIGVYWLRQSQDGESAWLFGAGRATDDGLTLTLYAAQGPRFGTASASTDLSITPAGTAEIRFDGCSRSAWVWRSDTDPNLPQEKHLEQLIGPPGTRCP